MSPRRKAGGQGATTTAFATPVQGTTCGCVVEASNQPTVVLPRLAPGIHASPEPGEAVSVRGIPGTSRAKTALPQTTLRFRRNDDQARSLKRARARVRPVC